MRMMLTLTTMINNQEIEGAAPSIRGMPPQFERPTLLRSKCSRVLQEHMDLVQLEIRPNLSENCHFSTLFRTPRLLGILQ